MVRIPQRPLLKFKQKQNLAYLIDLQGFDVFGLSKRQIVSLIG
jgi:hypothetical protein